MNQACFNYQFPVVSLSLNLLGGVAESHQEKKDTAGREEEEEITAWPYSIV